MGKRNYQTINGDILIIGTGLSGLSLALYLAENSNFNKIILISKAETIQANTWRAQGGIAASIEKTSSAESHIKDTIKVGDGLCSKETVEKYVNQSADRINDLIRWGVQFDLKDGKFDLAKEGGHSERRILHVDDQTGKAIHSALLDKVLNHENIEIINHTLIYKLEKSNNKIVKAYGYKKQSYLVFSFDHCVLATGGLGKCFLYTSNWDGALGDGINLAYNAGATLESLEFTQFHPTCLYHKNNPNSPMKNFLITEALRGEGAKLLNINQERFMKKYDSRLELASRDIVSRAIHSEIKLTKHPCVYLDVSHLNPTFFKKRFPGIYKRCKELGFSLPQDLIPVVPAAHYLCGGIKVSNRSQTNISNLWALGEVSSSGLHGANRLASNSLLECLATSYEAYKGIKASNHLKDTKKPVISQIDGFGDKPIPTEMLGRFKEIWHEVRNEMWVNVSIIRSEKSLTSAQQKISQLMQEISQYTLKFSPTKELIELNFLASSSQLIIASALNRKESRGCHFREDYPNKKHSFSKTLTLSKS